MANARWIGAVGSLALLALGLAAAEVAARLAFGMPRMPVAFDAGLPPLHEPDPELGWRNRAGAVEWPGRARDAGRPIRMTFWPGGLRATAPAKPGGRPELVVVGCSYAQGWALDDADAFAWQLQQRHPELAVANLATAGYGAYQSLLALERHFSESDEPVARVVYGMIEHHEIRNVAPAGWLRRLATATEAGRLAVPWASLGPDGRLVRHAPESYPDWPLAGSLASVAHLEAGVAAYHARARPERLRPVMEALLVALRDASARRGAPLLVALLEARPPARAHYRGFLAAHGIDFVDCVDRRTLDPAFGVPGYGHPGREINAFWAGCIGGALDAVR
jgi:hypothetical protein